MENRKKTENLTQHQEINDATENNNTGNQFGSQKEIL